MKTFKDLKFEPRYLSSQATMEFDNGYGVSVLSGNIAYSNGIDTYELAVLKNGDLCYDTPITDDVLAYITEEEVTKAMEEIQKLESISIPENENS